MLELFLVRLAFALNMAVNAVTSGNGKAQPAWSSHVRRWQSPDAATHLRGLDPVPCLGQLGADLLRAAFACSNPCTRLLTRQTRIERKYSAAPAASSSVSLFCTSAVRSSFCRICARRSCSSACGQWRMKWRPLRTIANLHEPASAPAPGRTARFSAHSRRHYARCIIAASQLHCRKGRRLQGPTAKSTSALATRVLALLMQA